MLRSHLLRRKQQRLETSITLARSNNEAARWNAADRLLVADER